MPLWVKVLALEDPGPSGHHPDQRQRWGIPQALYHNVCVGLKAKLSTATEQILLNGFTYSLRRIAPIALWIVRVDEPHSTQANSIRGSSRRT